MNFRVQKASNYDGTSSFRVQYNLPLEIGCFSIDSNSKYRDDDHQMKYLSMPGRLTDLHMNLNAGYQEHIPVYEDTDVSFNSILKWILLHQDVVKQHFVDKDSSRTKIDFIFLRGLLTAIGSTIYEKSEDWLIYATKFRSVIYLECVQTERKAEKEKSLGSTEKGVRMNTWGFKFEQYMVSEDANSKPDTSVPVNENEKYFTVLKGKLGNHSLLFNAEVDGIDPKQFTTYGYNSKSTIRYVELKTSKIITNSKEERNFRRYKLIKWYLQSYFAGIPKVICGFRDDEGIVRELDVFNVGDMPKIANDCWSPTACLNFTSKFLSYVKRCVVKDDPDVVYRIYWEPNSDIICEELDSEYRFLPEWYTSKVTVM